ncbi:MAG: shikimate kinase, partial [Bacteroidota bacterium]
MNKNRILIVMGVSGTGKSTIGKLLSEKLDVPFFDGDDFHPERNILKMKSGQPLTDEDRKDWLLVLNDLAKKQQKSNGGIIACSALK